MRTDSTPDDIFRLFDHRPCWAFMKKRIQQNWPEFVEVGKALSKIWNMKKNNTKKVNKFT